ncbi:MAG: hypothetical protein ABI178_04925 [Rhodanobacter sp.]
MQARDLSLFDQPFGADLAHWLAASPYQQMRARILPLLAVCSGRRLNSCPQADALVRKAESFGTLASMLEMNLSNSEIKQQRGLPSDYTLEVETFMRLLHPALARRLDDRSSSIDS